MNIISKSLLIASASSLALMSNVAFGAAIVGVSFSSGSGKTLTDHVGNPINGGTVAVNGDGAVIQIGYFTNATAVSLFGNGNWVALTGQGGLNSAFNTTSVGDGINSGSPNGKAIFSLTFDATDSTKNQGLPIAGTPLGVRFFDGLSVASSGFYETVVSPDWAFIPPTEPPLNGTVTINLTNANAKLASTNTTPGASIQTNTPTAAAPEPTSAALLMVGLVSLASRRRRAVKV